MRARLMPSTSPTCFFGSLSFECACDDFELLVFLAISSPIELMRESEDT
jgi:hypothetical protein